MKFLKILPLSVVLFTTDYGKIRPSRLIDTCARHQLQLATAIKRARFLALIPYIRGHQA